ncbi:hypothetical protein [Paenibacillus sp. J2TS4]|uniref:hypothetical protein n=1 Tax=Paenibacillus sp. J2TS4 TaxID=2807194 RepID=UPI001B1F4797|nr:hypothetical protein [Paenibacillus sp. J2TS4]GIP31297.1 hypothetical protein J2TS4_05070 [Paenibacillus sp. J2TS4]
MGTVSAPGAGQADTRYTVNGLSPALTYEFRVEAADATGNWTNNGPQVRVTTTGQKDEEPPKVLPGSRIELADKVNTTWLTIRWSAATDNIGVKKYLIYVNGELKGTNSSNGFFLWNNVYSNRPVV